MQARSPCALVVGGGRARGGWNGDRRDGGARRASGPSAPGIAFTPDNDPHGEHDFGSFEYAGKTIFWKVDCYDRDLNYGSPDPADENVTERVLTVMLAEPSRIC